MKLYAQVADSPEQGRVQWEMKARPGRIARTVVQSVRVGVIHINAPKRLSKAPIAKQARIGERSERVADCSLAHRLPKLSGQRHHI